MKKPKEHYADLERLTELIGAGRLTPIIDRGKRCAKIRRVDRAGTGWLHTNIAAVHG